MPKPVAEIKFGERTLPLVPQPWAAIVYEFGQLYDHVREAGGEIDTDELDAAAIVGFLGQHAYEALEVFVPQLSDYMPRWQFMGYRSRDAMEAGDYSREDNAAPSFPQIIEAFEAAFATNGGKRLLDALGKVIDPKLLKAEMGLALSDWREARNGSPSSPGASGTSPPTNSGTTDPISPDPATSESDANGHSSGTPLSVSG